MRQILQCFQKNNRFECGWQLLPDREFITAMCAVVFFLRPLLESSGNNTIGICISISMAQVLAVSGNVTWPRVSAGLLARGAHLALFF